jgi:hypothetical protein
MSDMAEYYREQRDKEQQRKAARLKKDTELIGLYAGLFLFEFKTHNENHFSLFHKKKGRLDYWPTTGKAMWVTKKSSVFVISDIEQFLLKHFE